MRTVKTYRFGILAAGVLAAALALSGCAAEGGADAPGAPDAGGSTTGSAACAGVRVVVDTGELAAQGVDTCVETDEPLTAVQAFEQAGVELEGVSTSDAFFACRVAGAPAAGTPLEYEGGSYDSGGCSAFGPVWAWWGLFAGTDSGWQFAQEGADTLEIAPGDSVAFAWQFGDTTETRPPQQ